MKRKAEFDLDRNAIEKEGLDFYDQNRDNNNESSNKIQTPEEIAKRRFLKIKGLKTNNHSNESPSQKPMFHLTTPLETKIVEAPKAVFSFIPNNNISPPEILEKKTIGTMDTEKNFSFSNEKLPETLQNPNQKIIETQKIFTPPVFETNGKSPEKTKKEENLVINEKPEEKVEKPEKKEKSPVKEQEKIVKNEGNEEKKNESEDKQPKNFGFKINNPLSFSNPLQNKTQEPEKTPQSLFSSNNPNTSNSESIFKPSATGLFGNNNTSTSLFSSGSIFQQSSTNTLGGGAQTSIFGSSMPSGGLFSNLGNLGNMQNTQKPSIFGGIGSNNTGLFNNIGKESSGESSDEGDDEGKEPDSPEIDPSKSSVNYQYEEYSNKLCSKKVNKFKANDRDCFETGFISLEKLKDKESYIVCYRNQAKLIMYRGWVLKKLSITGSLNKRTDSMTLVLFSDKKDENGKLSKDICKIMFGSQQECEEFKKEVEKIVNQ